MGLLANAEMGRASSIGDLGGGRTSYMYLAIRQQPRGW